MELKLPVALDQKATDRGEACVLQAACKHTIGAWPRLSGEVVGGGVLCVRLPDRSRGYDEPRTDDFTTCPVLAPGMHVFAPVVLVSSGPRSHVIITHRRQ